MPVGRAAALGDHRYREFRGREQDEHPYLAIAVRPEPEAHPPDLQKGDTSRVPQSCGSGAAPLTTRCPEPLRGQGQPHHHVSGQDDGVVPAVEGPRNAGCQNECAHDLHQRDEPVGHIVGVVRRGEPREVHPGPPDREEDHGVAEDPVSRIPLGHRVHEPGTRLRDRDHEAEIEQELQRGGRAVRFPGVAPDHDPRQRPRQPAVRGTGIAFGHGPCSFPAAGGGIRRVSAPASGAVFRCAVPAARIRRSVRLSCRHRRASAQASAPGREAGTSRRLSP